jgi:2-methylcitrate dehydratase PrpD
MNVAVSMAAGLSENATSPTKAVHAGRASAAGLEAALLTRSGLTSAPGAIDGAHGAMVAFGPRNGGHPVEAKELTRIASNAGAGLIRKQFPTFGATHLSVEAALDVRAELAPGTGIASVTLTLPVPRGGSAVRFEGKPSTPSEARHSFPYVVALALARGLPLPRFFRPEELWDEATRRVWSVLTVEQGDEDARSAGYRSDYAIVSVTTDDGDTHHARRDFPTHTISGPVVDDKFRMCSGEVTGTAQTEGLLTRLRRVAALPDLRGLFEDISP